MLCTICGSCFAKQYQRKTEGREFKLTLCEECYEKYYPEQEANDFFASFVGRAGGRDKTCPVCGMTLAEFRRIGLLGCADCYKAFREELTPTIRYIQGALQHEGKTPSAEADEKYDTVRELVRLQETLRIRIEEAEHDGDELELVRLREELMRVNRKLYGGEVF